MMCRITIGASVLAAVSATMAFAQDVPADYQAALATLERTGDFKDQVLKVNIPRGDLHVTIAGQPVPTPLGFGGWVAFTHGDGGMDAVMGDLVLTEAEVNPVMSALLDHGIEVTALHNHFFYEAPRIFYMHVHGHGTTADLAARLKPALALIPKPPTPAGPPVASAFDGPALSAIVGAPGETMGPVYKITIGRADLTVRDESSGARISTRMGLNTWAAFAGTMEDAMVAGDVAMLAGEMTRVLKALRSHGLEVVAIHHHMTSTQPQIFFLHYQGRGKAADLAAGVRAAVNELAH